MLIGIHEIYQKCITASVESIMLLKSVSFKELVYRNALLIHLAYSKKAHRTHQQTIKFYIALLEYVVIIDCVKIKVKRNV